MAILEVVEGDITTEQVDAIVNAANEQLVSGGGVCGAIFRGAGWRLGPACEAVAPCPTGDARITPAFDLPATFIVHAVGPIWQGGGVGEAELLASAYRRALQVAAEAGVRSIAVPAISTGIFGYPLGPATEIAVAAGRAAPAAIEVVRYVCFDATTRDAYVAALAATD